jgi:hypothetical protein
MRECSCSSAAAVARARRPRSSGSGRQRTASWSKSPLGDERSSPPTDRAKRGVKGTCHVTAPGVRIGPEGVWASIRDNKRLRATLRFDRPADRALEVGLCLDKGYDYSEVLAAHVPSRVSGPAAPQPLAQDAAEKSVSENTSWRSLP